MARHPKKAGSRIFEVMKYVHNRRVNLQYRKGFTREAAEEIAVVDAEARYGVEAVQKVVGLLDRWIEN